MLFIDALNEKIKDFKFELISATLNSKSLVLDLELLYPDGILLTDAIREKVYKVCKEQFSEVKEFVVKYKKNYVEKYSMSDIITEFLCKNHPLFVVSEVKSSSNNVTLFCDKMYRDTKQVVSVLSDLNRYLEELLSRQVEIDCQYIDDETEEAETTFVATNTTSHRYRIGKCEKYIGEEIFDEPLIINSIKIPKENVVIAGKIARINCFETKPKTDKNGKERPPKKYYKFTVSDFTGDMNIIYFPPQTALPKMEKLEKGIDIVVQGNVEEDAFNNGLVLRPIAISLCDLPKDFLSTVITKSVPEKYNLIFPEQIVSTKQINLFEQAKDADIASYLKEHTLVVFDFETTGLDSLYDKIIEIGAVKLENGKMTETFSCFVNPEKHIPEDSSKINNIFDEDVAGAYTIEQVLPDFYKFCNGSTLVAYNIDFDYGFLSFAGKKNGYLFSNPQIDALALARTALKGLLKNYKLITVATHLGISLENAHRAVNDAIATAEVFVALGDSIEKIIN